MRVFLFTISGIGLAALIWLVMVTVKWPDHRIGDTLHQFEGPFYARAIVFIAAATLVVLLGFGAHTALGWMPRSWVRVYEDGDTESWRAILSGLFGLSVGLPIFAIFAEAPATAARRQIALERAEGLSKILWSAWDVAALERLLDEFKERASDAYPGCTSEWTDDPLHSRRGWRWVMLHGLSQNTEAALKKARVAVRPVVCEGGR